MKFLLVLFIAGCAVVSHDVDAWSSPPRLPVGVSAGLTLRQKDDVNQAPDWLMWRVAASAAYATSGRQCSPAFGLEAGPSFLIHTPWGGREEFESIGNLRLDLAMWALVTPDHWSHNDAGVLARLGLRLGPIEPYVGILAGQDDGDRGAHLFNDRSSGGIGSWAPQFLFGARLSW